MFLGKRASMNILSVLDRQFKFVELVSRSLWRLKHAV